MKIVGYVFIYICYIKAIWGVNWMPGTHEPRQQDASSLDLSVCLHLLSLFSSVVAAPLFLSELDFTVLSFFPFNLLSPLFVLFLPLLHGDSVLHQCK